MNVVTAFGGRTAAEKTVLQGPWGNAPGDPVEITFSRAFWAQGVRVTYEEEGMVLALLDAKGEVVLRRTLPYPKPPEPEAAL